jgi:hypothetical protein
MQSVNVASSILQDVITYQMIGVKVNEQFEIGTRKNTRSEMFFSADFRFFSPGISPEICYAIEVALLVVGILTTGMI